MRIGVVSDIHGNLPALQAVAADLATAGVDRIVNLGDILSGPMWPRETAQWLMAQDWPTIAGNHERYLLACAHRPGAPSDQYAYDQCTAEQRAWLAGLPNTLQLTNDVLLCHGTPDSDHT
jgi:predicted phosphodiesterase